MADTLPDDPVARAKAIALKLTTATTSGPGEIPPMMGQGLAGPAPSSESGLYCRVNLSSRRQCCAICS